MFRFLSTSLLIASVVCGCGLDRVTPPLAELDLSSGDSDGEPAQGGQLDTFFGSSGRFIEILGNSDLAWDTALLPDGGMVIAGNAQLTSMDVGVMKINPNGGDDPDFGDDATGHITLPSAGDEQTCGVIVVGNTMTITGSRGADDYYTQTYAARVSLTGELDASFGVGGVFLHNVATPDSASTGNPHAVGQEFVCQSFDDGDGAVVMAGHARFGDAQGRDLILMRMIDGVLDTGFATNGVARIDLGDNDRLWRAAYRDTHGRFVMCAMLGLDPGPLKIAVARVTPAGILDTTFAGIGYVVFPDAYPLQDCQGAFVDANERVLLTGYTPAGNGDMFIRRLLDDGTPDASFGVDGLVRLDIGGGEDRANDVTVDTRGRIIVVGQAVVDSQTDMAILRFLDDGSLDPRFGVNGIATFDVGGQHRSDIANSIEVDAQGRIYAIGTSSITAAGVPRNVFSGVRVLP